MTTFRVVMVIVLGSVLAAGCASSRSGKVYSRDEAQRVQKVQVGTVVAVQNVTIEGTKSKIGAAAGAVAGGISARGGGSGTGDRVAGVVGSVVGGLVGAATAGTWLVIAKGFKISSLAALIATLLAPLYVWLIIGPSQELIIATAVMTAILFWRHRSNIQRLLSGEESLIGKKD